MSDKYTPSDKFNEIIEALVPNPLQVPDLRVLVGMLGRSCTPGLCRLYLTFDLCDYVEVGEDDILHSVRLDGDGIAEMVWIKRDAKFLRTRIHTKDHTASVGGDSELTLAGNGETAACAYVVDKYRLKWKRGRGPVPVPA